MIRRSALSLIEVIASVMVVTVMLVPMAAVIRHSRHALADAAAAPVGFAAHRDAVGSIERMVAEAQIDSISATANRLEFRRRGPTPMDVGPVESVFVLAGDLIHQSDGTQRILTRDIRSFRIDSRPSPADRQAIHFAWRFRDPTTQAEREVTGLVTLSTQWDVP